MVALIALVMHGLLLFGIHVGRILNGILRGFFLAEEPHYRLL